jgi:MFS family permease
MLSRSESRPAPSLWRNRSFVALLAAQTVSLSGTQVTALALPTLAILSLHAGPAQVGLLVALPWLPLPLLGPFAGVIVDRFRRRPIMVAADLIRAVTLLSVPVLFSLGVRSVLHLYLVSATVGVFNVFFDVSYLSYLPSLVSREQLVEGNALLAQGEAAAQVAGPGLAGLLIGGVGAALTVTADAASYLVSALSLASIRQQAETSAAGRGERPAGIWAELREGADALVRHPIVRILVSVSALQNLGSTLAEAVILIFAYRSLHLAPGLVGAVKTAGSITFFLTALFAARLTRMLGVGRTLALSSLLGGLAYLVIPLGLLGAPALAFSLWPVIYGLHLPTYNVNVLSVRQALIPGRLQGRVTAVGRSVSVGTAGIGPLIGGFLGSTVGVTQTILVGGAIFLLGSLPLLARPVLGLRRQPALETPIEERREPCDTSSSVTVECASPSSVSAP